MSVLDTSPRPEDLGTRIPFIMMIIKQIAEEMGATVTIEPEFGFAGHIRFQNGKAMFFRQSHTDINPFGAVEIAKDKSYTSWYMKQFGFCVPEGQTFFADRFLKKLAHQRSIDDGWEYAQQLGLPVILKPNSLSQGIMVAKVDSEEAYYTIAKRIFAVDRVMIVQRFYSGNDYRVVVFDDEVLAAYQRFPWKLTGDGVSTIEELMQAQREHLISLGRKVVTTINDTRIEFNLKRLDLSLESVLEDGRTINVLDNANLSSGGNAIDLSEDIHQDWKDLAIAITKNMGLRLCGVDFLTNDLTQPMSEYVVIEINAFPGVAHFASIGPKQYERVIRMYTKVLRAVEAGNAHLRV